MHTTCCGGERPAGERLANRPKTNLGTQGLGSQPEFVAGVLRMFSTPGRGRGEREEAVGGRLILGASGVCSA